MHILHVIMHRRSLIAITCLLRDIILGLSLIFIVTFWKQAIYGNYLGYISCSGFISKETKIYDNTDNKNLQSCHGMTYVYLINIRVLFQGEEGREYVICGL